MSYWTGTHWVAEQAATPPPRPGRVRHIIEALTEGALVALIVAGLVAGSALAAGGRPGGPTLSVATSSAKTIANGTGSLTVRGTGFLPSAGGQMVILWVGYPDDYCSADHEVCHGFYAYPWVDADGSFSVSYDGVVMQSGTGVVKASQYSARNDKWRTVASEEYTAP